MVRDIPENSDNTKQIPDKGDKAGMAETMASKTSLATGFVPVAATYRAGSCQRFDHAHISQVGTTLMLIEFHCLFNFSAILAVEGFARHENV